MAKISTIYNLGKTQHELDFVDIDTDADFPVYLNPFIFSARTDHFSINASRTVSGFFQHNLDLINNGQQDQARQNFSYLKEPNETCLGMSQRRPMGRGMGTENADDLFDSILSSGAVTSGLVENLEDTAIFIDGIGRDKVSDMTTNIIRKDLITYTQNQCDLLGIAMTQDVASGFYWDSTNRCWIEEYTRMLVINGRKILLVPKAVVSYVEMFNNNKYHQHYALEFLQDDHLRRNTTLVQVVRNDDGSIKRRFVTKKDLIEKELTSKKDQLLDFTRKHPAVFQNFRSGTASDVKALTNEELESSVDETELVDYMIASLRAIPTGRDHADEYHTLMVGVLEYIFYPNLMNPIKENPINQGRKRIDITFDNGAPSQGFFYTLQHSHNIPCPYIPVECKNYSGDVANPELDQMAGRLSPNRGKFGIIVCRDIQNEDLFLNRCSDSFTDDHGLIVPITDIDIIEILTRRKEGIEHHEDVILREKTRRIIQRQ